ncbi:glycoside hydrolase family 2 protein [Plantibacter sp. YIM 135347]|uniref:glycoside hydrolase family 2 protein n=1 Tax=Plantibacter sp. YIM 135347 TaxID=3423919 RepID=UPI003D33BFDB
MPSAPAQHPLYVWPRGADRQILLEHWQLAWTPQSAPLDADFDRLDALDWHDVVPGAMIQWQWYLAGLGPNPYLGTNSAEYRWMAEQRWWFRTAITLPEDWTAPGPAVRGRATPLSRLDLVFDGVDHDATVWIDGVSTGEHFGAFGGPAIDASTLLEAPAGSAHEVVVLITPAGTGAGKEEGTTGRLVKSETYSTWINNPDLMTAGIWRPVRLVATTAERLERPQVTTSIERTADGSVLRARVDVEVEVVRADVSPDLRFVVRYGQQPPLDDPRFGEDLLEDPRSSSNASIGAHVGAQQQQHQQRQRREHHGTVRAVLIDAAGAVVATSVQDVVFGRGRQWTRLALDVADPQLWWPHGLGDAHQYTLRLTLHGAAHDSADCGERHDPSANALDELTSTVGIRSLTLTRSAAPRTAEQWMDWQAEINGEPLLILGMNWMPVDLLHLTAAKLDHFLRLARDAGVQLIRVWGGGLIETTEFYERCDALGLLVWQDFPLNTEYTCEGLPLDVWEQQVAWSVTRLRNHPSLVVWCGGNEFDPYLPVNAAAVGIMERTVAGLDGSRPFVRSCSDPGDVHPYLDADTSWYLPLYRHAPAITEWGGHALPPIESLREFLSPEELDRPLAILDTSDAERFGDTHRALRHHWAEFRPIRIPRMLGRAALFDDLATGDNGRFVEAVALGAAEITETVALDFRASDVAATMILPWVFSRPWPSVGMQVLDHSGRPTPGHAALRRAYAPIAIAVRVRHESLAAGEELRVQLAVNRDADAATLATASVEVRVYDDALVLRGRFTTPISADTFPEIVCTVPSDAGALAIIADVIGSDAIGSDGERLARTVRLLRISPGLADADARAAYRGAPTPTAMFGERAFRPAIAERSTTLQMSLDGAMRTLGGATDPHGVVRQVITTVTNTGTVPAAFVRWSWSDGAWILDADDDFFWLEPGERRSIAVRFSPALLTSSFVEAPDAGAGTEAEPDLTGLSVSAWNAEAPA